MSERHFHHAFATEIREHVAALATTRERLDPDSDQAENDAYYSIDTAIDHLDSAIRSLEGDDD